METKRINSRNGGGNFVNLLDRIYGIYRILLFAF